MLGWLASCPIRSCQLSPAMFNVAAGESTKPKQNAIPSTFRPKRIEPLGGLGVRNWTRKSASFLNCHSKNDFCHDHRGKSVSNRIKEFPKVDNCSQKSLRWEGSSFCLIGLRPRRIHLSVVDISLQKTSYHCFLFFLSLQEITNRIESYKIELTYY